MRELNVGMIGYKFMGKAHSNAYARVNMFFDADMQVNRKVICGRDEAGVKAAMDKEGNLDWRG